MPVSAHGMPYRPRSKRPMEYFLSEAPSAPRHCCSMPNTTRFVLVPMSVHVPPKMDANDSGIITCSFGMFMFSAHRWTMGIITATTGVLFRNPDVSAMGTISRSCAPAIVRGLPSSLDMYQSRPPVALIPAATTNNVATVIRPSLLNPARPSSTETIPAAMRIVSAPIITWSGWTTSHSKHANAPTTTATVNHPSHAAPIVRDEGAACRGGRAGLRRVTASGGGRSRRAKVVARQNDRPPLRSGASRGKRRPSRPREMMSRYVRGRGRAIWLGTRRRRDPKPVRRLDPILRPLLRADGPG